MSLKVKKVHALQWVFDSLQDQPTFLQKKMFGMEAAYLSGKLQLVMGDGDEPWNGLLICTEREFHSSLITQFPELKPHPILGKWLYLSQLDSSFESVAQQVVDLCLRHDPRIGVEPKPKKKAKSHSHQASEQPIEDQKKNQSQNLNKRRMKGTDSERKQRIQKEKSKRK